MAFVPRLTSDGMQGNPWWYSSGNPFYPTYGLPNCTCYAYGRYAEIRNAFANLPTSDAGGWFNTAVARGFDTGQTPQLGAVACYASRSGTYAGHVAVVEQINQDGSITTSNSAWQGTYFWLQTVYASDNYCAPWMTTSEDLYFQGFIYNDAVIYRSCTPQVVAAMCGCFKRESTVNPGIWESLIPTSFDHQYQYDGIGGYGLGQWTNVGTPYGRCYNLHVWVTANGYADGDGNGQLAYIIHENYWANSSQTHGSYTNLKEFLNSQSTSIADLTWDFLANWEGVPGNAYSERLTAANNFYNYILAHMNDNPADYQWISGNYFLNWNQMYNNVMCAYFWLSGYAPTPVPPTPTKKRKMPLWMYLRYLP